MNSFYLYNFFHHLKHFCCFLIILVFSFSTISMVVRDEKSRDYVTELMILAQCESRCYVNPQHSKATPSPYNDHDNFTVYECVTDHCLQCVNATLRIITTLEDCYTFCATNGSCRQSCDCIYHIKSEGLEQSKVAAKSSQPKFACQDISVNDGYRNISDGLQVHVVVQNGVEWESEVRLEPRVPLVFVMEIRVRHQERVGRWLPLGKTKFSYLEVPHLKAATFYQLRTQTLAPDGILPTSTISNWFQTLKDNVTLVSPKQLNHVETYVEGQHLIATFNWEPPAEHFCYYNLFWFHPGDDDVFQKYIFLPQDGPLIRLAGFKFEANYTLQMVTTTGDSKMESSKIQTNFITGTCLEAFNSNFTLCGPGPPEDLKYRIINADTDDKVSIHLTWRPPLETTETNFVYVYEVKLAKMVSFQSLPFIMPFVVKVNVAGNTTFATVDNIPRNNDYVASVMGVSEGGNGKVAITHFTVTSKDTDSGIVPMLLLFVGLPGAISLFLVLACVFAYKSHRRCIEKTIRDRYFESLEQNQPIEHPNPITVNQPSNMDEGVFEIDFNMLLLGDVLGRGAFGLVVKAQMRSNKPFTLWENVAVKMLHPGYDEQDEQYLLAEIEMMKAIGHHPHLVSLIAYCKKSPNVCLVVEHCPYGDLQSYLRIYRNKKIRDKQNNGLSNNGRKSLNDSGIVDQHFNFDDCSVGNSLSSRSDDFVSSGEKKNRRRSRGLRSSEYSNFEGPDDWSNEQDVKLPASILLSFAHQVSMGMEYLSQNKLVHCDLAARNVLVYDRKMVKVSDFGLMRDVYECNFYRRKTDGKLPVKWMAHESIFDQIFTTKSDVWSFGILLYELVTLGGVPYPGISNLELVGLLEKNYRMEKPTNCDDYLYSMMTSCWNNNPVSRPSFTQIRTKLESVLESSLNYLTLDLSADEEKYYKILEKPKSVSNEADILMGDIDS